MHAWDKNWWAPPHSSLAWGGFLEMGLLLWEHSKTKNWYTHGRGLRKESLRRSKRSPGSESLVASLIFSGGSFSYSNPIKIPLRQCRSWLPLCSPAARRFSRRGYSHSRTTPNGQPGTMMWGYLSAGFLWVGHGLRLFAE